MLSLYMEKVVEEIKLFSSKVRNKLPFYHCELLIVENCCQNVWFIVDQNENIENPAALRILHHHHLHLLPHHLIHLRRPNRAAVQMKMRRKEENAHRKLQNKALLFLSTSVVP